MDAEVSEQPPALSSILKTWHRLFRNPDSSKYHNTWCQKAKDIRRHFRHQAEPPNSPWVRRPSFRL